MKTSYGYLMASKTRRLYVRVTTNLEQRVWQHKVHWFPDSFTARYNITKLVWTMDIPDPGEAIAWEKRIKKWSHVKKVALIEQRNPRWNDLAWSWFDGIEETRVELEEARRAASMSKE